MSGVHFLVGPTAFKKMFKLQVKVGYRPVVRSAEWVVIGGGTRRRTDALASLAVSAVFAVDIAAQI